MNWTVLVLSVPEAQLHIQGARTREILNSTYHTIEISRCAIAHPRSGARHPEMINALAFEQFVGDDLDAET